MEFLCRHCGYMFKKILTLKEKTEKVVPKFCTKECAFDYSISRLTKKGKKKKNLPHSSKEEIEFGKVVSSFFPDLKNQFQIKNYDHHYDFYCPYLNILIEYNGEYWHNQPRNTKKDKKHLQEATRQNIGLAVITDKEWKSFINNGVPDKKKLLKLFQSSLKNDI